MLEIFASVPHGLLVISTLILTIVLLMSMTIVAILFRFLYKMICDQTEQLDDFKSDLRAVCSGAVGVGHHLEKLDETIRGIVNRQDMLEMQETGSGGSYKQAIKMVRRGANVDQVMEDCGLARGEAELAMLAKHMDKGKSAV